jgi:hypothetical protein
MMRKNLKNGRKLKEGNKVSPLFPTDSRRPLPMRVCERGCIMQSLVVVGFRFARKRVEADQSEIAAEAETAAEAEAAAEQRQRQQRCLTFFRG